MTKEEYLFTIMILPIFDYHDIARSSLLQEDHDAAPAKRSARKLTSCTVVFGRNIKAYLH